MPASCGLSAAVTNEQMLSEQVLRRGFSVLFPELFEDLALCPSLLLVRGRGQ